MSTIPPIAKPSRASDRAALEPEIKPDTSQYGTRAAPRSVRVTGLTARTPRRSLSARVTRLAAVVTVVWISASLRASSSSGSRPIPATSNAASAAAP